MQEGAWQLSAMLHSFEAALGTQPNFMETSHSVWPVLCKSD